MSNIVAIVGRPNVGKSTLFNRLTESRQAIVDQTAGVTRDRQYGKSDWNGKYFSIIDTGGYVMGGDDEFEIEIRKQVQLAVDEADTILFLVDAREGLTPMDEDVANMLRKCTKKVILVANKVDNAKEMDGLAEFYALGLGDPYPIAGISGSGTGDLLDAVVADFEEGEQDNSDGLPRIAVVGRPNVGKSSFINFITGQERNIVTPIAGTTRDSVFTRYNMFGFDFNFVQDNQSGSIKGVLRGLHYQKQYPQAKLVRVIKGVVYDVAVDLRPGSPTYGKHHGELLTDQNNRQFLIPRGFAHGYLVLSNTAEFHYKCDDFYHPNDEGGIAWNDPEIGIDWPEVTGAYPGNADPSGYCLADGTPLILSEKDKFWTGINDYGK